MTARRPTWFERLCLRLGIETEYSRWLEAKREIDALNELSRLRAEKSDMRYCAIMILDNLE